MPMKLNAGYLNENEINDSVPNMTIKFSDSAVIGSTKKTSEGYLVATSRIARTGVQEYLARELGDVAIAAGFSRDDVVRVYRHADQVFAADALQSLTRIPLTVNHPSVMVDADNWKDFAVGDLGDRFTQDGDWLVVNPMLKDAEGIKAASTTHKEFSAGYTAEIVAARDGIDADFEMVNIRFNHLALVPKGRAGSQARLADSWGATPLDAKQKDKTMDFKTIIFGDKSVNVEAKDADTVTAVLKEHKTAIDAKDAAIGELKAKLAKAEDKVETFDAAVEAAVKAKAMREAVKAAFGDEAVKGASDAEIAGMFKVIGSVADNSVRDAITQKKTKVDDAWGDVIAKLPDYGMKGKK